MNADQVAERLLEAQVAWLLETLSGDQLVDLLEHGVEDLLDVATRLPVASVLDAETLAAVVGDIVAQVATAPGLDPLLDAAAERLHAGPPVDVTPAELLSREHAERIADEIVHAVDPLERVLDGLTRSPLLAAMATRFVGRVVTDVLQTNQAMARKLPGVGGLVSAGMGLGTSAAGKVLGAAQGQLDAVLGESASKGAGLMMRRLNKIVVDTLRDPLTRDAVLEVYDLYADRPIPPPSRHADVADVRRVLALVRDVAAAALPSQPVHELVEAVAEDLLEAYADRPVADLLRHLGVERDLAMTHLSAVVPGIVDALRESGDLERLLRRRLGVFWTDPEVIALLAR